MKSIRRSLNKNQVGGSASALPSTSTAAHHPSGSNAQYASTSTVRPVQAPAPPKRVIRAVAAYRSASTEELSFQEGDFFHVVSDEGGEEWFDASNPMTGARGMVPASFFQVLGRNVREMIAQKPRQGSPGQPSPTYGGTSFAQQQQQAPRSTAPPPQSTVPAPATNGRPSGRPQSTPKTQPLYGVVQFDFAAERPDELEAKRGEPIIVIAQSNHEWFVAKPIGRLGGPGLIPVAFVEIQDMTTGKPVENVDELIRSAVIPKVEEWKKATADYKSASIPLGRFDFSNAGSAPTPSPSSGPSATANASPSLPAPPSTDSAPDQGNESEGEDVYDPDQRASFSLEREKYGIVTSASVESFHQEEGSFWFHLRAFFSTGASLVLYRLYQDFYDFQVALMDAFPVEAGRVPPGGEKSGRPRERILPMMPGPTDHEDEVVCAQRVRDLSTYLADLCQLPDALRASYVMYDFFVPRAGDVEVALGNGNGQADVDNAEKTRSIDGQYGELVDYLDKMDEPNVASLNLGVAGQQDEYATYRPSQQQQQAQAGAKMAQTVQQRKSAASKSTGSHSDQRDSQSQGSSEGRYRPQQSYQAAYPTAAPPSQAAQPSPVGSANHNVPFVKIKIFHRNTDDLIAIRVPPTVTFPALLDKVRERLGGDVSNLRFREEVGSTHGSSGHGQVVMAGGARLISLENNADLERWIHSGARMVLYAD